MPEQVVTEIIVDASKAREGLTEYTTALRTAGDEADRSTTLIDKNAGRIANAYLAKLDPAINASQKLAKETSTIEAAIGGLEGQFRRGLGVDQYNQRMTLLATRMGTIKAASADLASGTLTADQAMAKLAITTSAAAGSQHEFELSARETTLIMRTLAREGVGTFAAIASGGSVTSALTATFTRLAYEMTLSKGLFKLWKEEVTALLSGAGGLAAIGVGVAAVGVAMVGLGIYAEAAASEQAKLRTELAATRDDAVTMADTVKRASQIAASSSSVTASEAIKAAQIIAANPLFSGTDERLAELTKTAHGLAQVLGIELVDAAKKLSEGISDPAKVAKELATAVTPLRQIDAATLDLITHLQAVGKTAEASSYLMDKLKEAEAGVVSTALQTEWNKLKEAITSTGSSGKSLLQEFGEVMSAFAENVVRGLRRVVEAFQGFRQWLSDQQSRSAAGSPMVGLEDFGYSSSAQNRPASSIPGVSPSDLSFLPGQIRAASASRNLDPDFMMALQRAEGALDKLGNWADSSTGAIGAMQMTRTTAQGMLGQPGNFPDVAGMQLSDLRSQEGNVKFGASLAAHLLIKYKDPYLATLAYHDGEGVIDAYLKGLAQPSQAAFAEADKVTSGYHGTGFAGPAFGPGVPTQADIDFNAKKAATRQSALAGSQALESAPSQAATIEKLNKELRQYADLRAEIVDKIENDPLVRDEETKRLQTLDVTIAQTTADLAKAVDPTMQQTQALLDQAAAAGIVNVADQKLAEARSQFARERAQDPAHAATEAQEALRMVAIQDQLSAEFDHTTNQMKLTIDQQNKMAEAQEQGGMAVVHATSQQKALADVMGKISSLAPDFAKKVEERTKLYDQEAAALARIKAIEENRDLNHQLEMAHLQIDTLGMEYDARQRLVALREYEYQLRKNNPGLDAAELQSMLAKKDAILSLTQISQDSERNLSYLSNAFTSAFNVIGDAITQSFVQGGAAAVNWGNVVKSVLSQIIKMFLELAILNPIKNALFPSQQSSPTLSGVFGSYLLGGGGGGGGGGAGLIQAANMAGMIGAGAGFAYGGGVDYGSMLNYGMSDAGGGYSQDTAGVLAGLRLANGATSGGAFYGGGGGGGGMNLFSTVAQANSMRNLFGGSTISGNFGNAGVFSQGGMLNGFFPAVDNFMGTPIFGFGAQGLSGATDAALAGMGGEFGPATLGQVAAQAPFAMTAGGLITGVGAGFGAGALLGGMVQSGLNKSGPAPMIGAGAGALAGAVIGSVVPVIGTVIGGLIGGIIGGVGGGFIGPRPKSPFSSISLGIGAGGFLDAGAPISQLADTTNIQADVYGNAGWLNRALVANRLQLTSLGPVGSIGENSPNGPQSPWKFADFATAFPHFEFGAAGRPGLTAALSGRSFSSIDDLGKMMTAVNQFTDAISSSNAADHLEAFLSQLQGVATADIPAKLQAITTFVLETVPNLTKVSYGSIQDALDANNTKYAAAIQMAQQIGYAEDHLTAARNKGNAAIIEAASYAQLRTDQALGVRYHNAAAILDPTHAAAAAMIALDTQQAAERKSYSDSLKSIYGDTFAQTQDYANEMAYLEVVLGEERLAAQKQSNASLIDDQKEAQRLADMERARGVATSTVQSLYDYAHGLEYGPASPLSPQDQYARATSEFNAVNGAAQAGDFTSIQKLQSYSDTLLNTSHAVYGSGVGFVADYKKVLDAIGSVASQSPETLTTEAYNAGLQTQTQALTDSQSKLGDLLKSILLELQQNNGRPARAAA